MTQELVVDMLGICHDALRKPRVSHILCKRRLITADEASSPQTE